MSAITFQPAKHPNGPALPPMEGEMTAYGLVIHVSCQTMRAELGFYDISDPVTGALVCWGTFPGRDGAVDGLAHFLRWFYGKYPNGDFRAALPEARNKLACRNLDDPESEYHDCHDCGDKVSA